VQVLIIGNGIAGVTTALALRKRRRDWGITLVSGESDTFFSRTALMYVFMGQLRLEDTQPYEPHVWREKRIERVRGWVSGIDVAARRVHLDDGRTLAWDKLVLATGSTPNRFGWPGERLEGVQGLYTLQDLETLERSVGGARRAVVVGGGLIGVELAEMLHTRGLPVTLLARESAYWNNALPAEEAALVTSVVRGAGIDLRLSTGLAHIEGDARGRAAAAVDTTGGRHDAQIVGLTAGVRPNLSAVVGSGVETGRGIRVDRTLRTSVPDAWACGDCAEIVEPGQPPGAPGRVEQLWYTGRMQGEVCAANVAGESVAYDRGIWFNSARFFDLDWHTYGHVPGALDPPDPGLRHAVWVDAPRRRLLRIVARAGAVVGVNSLGLRQRQTVWTQWITQGRSALDVLPCLDDALFEPEFTGRLDRRVADTLRAQLA
jgi:NADPH-dependent 2,4-dienoyl-CoA reductase/sulfur reductase-like enzyme